jgi:2,4-dienoyl-CoA reductase (NADPH2)
MKMAKKKHVHLLKLFQIRNVTFKNRMAKTSQWFVYPEPDGSVGERLKAFYASVARNGVGLVIVEESSCEYSIGVSRMPHILVDDDKFLPGLSGLAEIIHRHDTPAFVQITHAGPAHTPFDGQLPLAPSSIDPPAQPGFVVARELTIEKIKDIVERYSRAALRVKIAGFDGCEIHLGHYALGNAFLSRIQNKRHDEYGCDTLENRARFGREIIERTRDLVGPDFVVGIRLSAKEWGHPLGTTNKEAIEFAKMFEKAGADYIQSSGYGYNEFFRCWAPDVVLFPEVPETARSFAARVPKGALLPEATAIKKAVSIPVTGVGRLDADSGEKAINQGKIDMVWLGRRLMVDPSYARKVAEGRMEDIRPCTGCMFCFSHLITTTPVECRWNAFLGHEHEFGCDGVDFTPAKIRKKVMIIGAGPGGMETARVAALRGHEVLLYEREKNLGGLLPLAAFIKGRDYDDVSLALEWYRTQLQKMRNVKISLETDVDAKLVRDITPDVVVLSPGSKWEIPDIPGIRGANVVTTNELKEKARAFIEYLGSDAMSSLSKVYLPIGKKVIVLGGDLKGLEALEFLVKRGRKVILVEEEQPGEGMNEHLKSRFFPWMEAHRRITTYAGVTCHKVTAQGMVVTTKEGKRVTLEADTVMVIEKAKKNFDLYEALKGSVPELYLIGDAKEDKTAWIHGAVHDGARTALSL